VDGADREDVFLGRDERRHLKKKLRHLLSELSEAVRAEVGEALDRERWGSENAAGTAR
jgi:hypothetical protein